MGCKVTFTVKGATITVSMPDWASAMDFVMAFAGQYGLDMDIDA